MQRIKGSTNVEEKGRRGLADVVKLNETMLRVDFEATDKMVAGSFNVTVTDDSIPEYFPFKAMKDGGKTKVSATMNKDGNKILFANPANGSFVGHFEKMPCPEGQEPTAETKPGKKGKDYKQFAILIECDYKVGTKSLWKGCKYWVPFYPNFGKDEDGNLAVSGTGTGSNALFDLLEATGVAEHLIPFSENPLPEIQRIAQAEARKFEFVVVKGWVDTIIPAQGDEFKEEVEVPAKKKDNLNYDEDIEKSASGAEEIHPALQD